jgi:hypothetical protein
LEQRSHVNVLICGLWVGGTLLCGEKMGVEMGVDIFTWKGEIIRCPLT